MRVWACVTLFWFVNHTEFNLHRTVQGPKSISVWHESDAEGDEWKLDSIMVKDLTHKRLHKFTFGVDGMAGLKSTFRLVHRNIVLEDNDGVCCIPSEEYHANAVACSDLCPCFWFADVHPADDIITFQGIWPTT